jgi:hypothetical protein
MPRLGVSAVMLLTTANFLQQVMKELPILDEVTLMEMMIIVQILLICAIAIFHVIIHRVDHLIVKEKGRLKELHDMLVTEMTLLDKTVKHADAARASINRSGEQDGLSTSQRGAQLEATLDETMLSASAQAAANWLSTPISGDPNASPMSHFEKTLEMRALSSKGAESSRKLMPRLSSGVVHSTKEAHAAEQVGLTRAQIVAMKKLTSKLHHALNNLNIYVRVVTLSLWVCLEVWIFCYACVLLVFFLLLLLLLLVFHAATRTSI